MKAFINDNNQKFDWVFRAVTAVVLLECVFYAYVGIRGLGTVELPNYLGIVLSILMYISILRYLIQYFKKGKAASMNEMLFKFGFSSLAALIGLKEGNNTVFVCTAIMVFMVPGIIGHWEKKKKQIISMVIVLICAVISAAVNICHPVSKYLNYMGTWVYVLDALNQVIQWTLFCVLACVRGRINTERREENNN